MKTVEIYTTPICPYCLAAKRLLDRKGVAYQETDVSRDPALREAMMERAGGRRSVPQIFIGGAHVGGSDDIHLLDREGRLDPMLAD
ncbi:glutaredoxin 3 [Xinfangfangia sp. CPCC 101601]|uniref:Glutaredoxin n=1 Tax=Pseudogemmobacter lacusdianii TaxID=3069608 RepID=A0ABU0VTV8_9RHOB|nr:glutaredoxin 3 [Xinfangfangia sp. CPCC 101601]MDQ2065148.1 glutaredoxin 3 [Xinfangfangia sp. CPCC 101601]